MPSITTEIGNTILLHHEEHRGTIGSHYDFYNTILQRIIKELQPNISINFGVYSDDDRLSIFSRSNYVPADLIIDFQFEQLIYEETPNNYILSFHQDYKVNNILSKADIILEFAATNTKFVSTLDSWYKNKAVYVPGVYECSINNSMRDNNIITVHNLTNRRFEFLEKFNKHFKGTVTMDNYSADTLYDAKTILDSYKVYVDIHKEEHFFKTFSELRATPFVCTGILMLGESMCPYREEIPYYKHMVWGTYDTMPSLIENVLENYEDYREKYLYGLEDTIHDMKQLAYVNFKNAIMNFLDNGRGKYE